MLCDALKVFHEMHELNVSYRELSLAVQLENHFSLIKYKKLRYTEPLKRLISKGSTKDAPLAHLFPSPFLL